MQAQEWIENVRTRQIICKIRTDKRCKNMTNRRFKNRADRRCIQTGRIEDASTGMDRKCTNKADNM